MNLPEPLAAVGSHPLESAIENGRGRLKIGDAFWQCEGPELPAGTRVRVVAVASMVLKVEGGKLVCVSDRFGGNCLPIASE